MFGLKLTRKDNYSPKSPVSVSDISTPSARFSDDSKSSKNSSPRKHKDHHGSKITTPTNGNKNSNHGVKDLSSPEKVIKALHSHTSTSSKGLSYSKGDFFYVISETERSYKATNPITGLIGKVSKKDFEVFNRTRPLSPSITNTSLKSSVSDSDSYDDDSLKFGSLSGIVLYDFKPERPDELEANAGDKITIYAHHNDEWFIASHTDSSGKPYLIPIDFVSIIDPITGYASSSTIKNDIESVNLPTVEVWKKGVLQVQSRSTSMISEDEHSVMSSDYDGMYSTGVESVSYEGDYYWFQVRCELYSGKVRTLKRTYDDCYKFYRRLTDLFPSEAGAIIDSNGKRSKRILPILPRRVNDLNEAMAFQIKDQLNEFMNELVNLPDRITTSSVVTSFFKIKNNGFDEEKVLRKIDKPSKSRRSIASNRESKDYLKFQNSARTVSNFLSKHKRQISDAMKIEDTENILTGEDLRLFERLSTVSISTSGSDAHRNPANEGKQRIKIYYNDDIFALRLSPDTKLSDLTEEIKRRIEKGPFILKVKSQDSDGEKIDTDQKVKKAIENKARIVVRGI
ncbi:hypothetical protein Kpol_457p12 [Vanderwaltozyma polyspora DSM 70294]|uniref:Bud emergence protein 1 n=1 Tax=Vanderwaltozyma polyspora (strain ATCC 22028 / DSM 70294 / BCRC 21397 / CBS 2163 / NBRC 10782 / NRRL Y-8283 / UCD 57-17) TaxID=436907 RepID=A7TQV3_VANPO|nr:uncharacterized protein Kpol_457p12 [Vanderwaltozyma polyspora DSM 70294]EDO15361.1 hypothetical protein Kpol_457p12 [Vanderwaltozyma polyspora DSM 70294]